MNNNLKDPPDLARTIFGSLILVSLVVSTLWLLKPFLPAGIWATTIVITLWPIIPPIQKRLRNSRALTTLFLTSCLLLTIMVPLSVAVLTIGEHAGSVTSAAPETISKMLRSPPQWLADIPFVGERVLNRWRQVAGLSQEQVISKISPYIGGVASWLLSQLGGLGTLLLHLALTLVFVAILMMQGETAANGVLAFGRRLAAKRGENAVILAAKSVRAVALGVVGTALIQSVLAGLGLLIAGVPYSLALGSLVLVLGIVQIGAGPVMIGSLIWIYYFSSTGTLIGFGIWTLIVLAMDNFIRPVLIKRGVDLPILLIFGGVIGGLLAFGIIGLFIGPVVLAVSYTLLKAWVTMETV